MKESNILEKRDLMILQQYGLDKNKLYNCSIRTYYFSERVITEGIRCENLIIVTDGKAKVGTMTPNGKNLILCFYISSGILGDLELMIDSGLGSSTVTALNDLRCICIPVEENKQYLLNNLQFIRIVCKELAEKLQKDVDTTVIHTLYSGQTRLCRYILEASHDRWFRDIMSDVAYSIGISYRHLYRMIGKLCDDGILEKTDKGYYIKDINELTYLSKQR